VITAAWWTFCAAILYAGVIFALWRHKWFVATVIAINAATTSWLAFVSIWRLMQVS